MPDAAGGREGAQEFMGRVIEALPSGLYRVQLLSGARGEVTAHVSGPSGLLRVLPGEEVLVELMPYDTARGRIVRRKA